MKSVVQRVEKASVAVDGEVISSIEFGLLVLLGVADTDSEEEMKYMADKISNLRIFEDQYDKMNMSVKDVGGDVLVVSQFTLYGDPSKGNRPNYMKAAKPEKANKLYKQLCERLSNMGINTKKGKFQAMMDVELINSGPVTIIIEKENEPEIQNN